MSDKKMAKGKEHLSFGVFNPIGYVVLGFGSAADAVRARDSLLNGGYDESEMLVYSPDEVIAATEKAFADRGILSFLGGEREAAENHQALARAGCTFLTVLAPSDDEAARVVRVAKRGDLRVANKYGRGSMTTLS